MYEIIFSISLAPHPLHQIIVKYDGIPTQAGGMTFHSEDTLSSFGSKHVELASFVPSGNSLPTSHLNVMVDSMERLTGPIMELPFTEVGYGQIISEK